MSPGQLALSEQMLLGMVVRLFSGLEGVVGIYLVWGVGNWVLGDDPPLGGHSRNKVNSPNPLSDC